MAYRRRPDSPFVGTGSRLWMLPAALAGSSVALALLIIASGGQPVPIVFALAAIGAWMLREPLVAVVPMVVAQIIWLVGNYAPGGVQLLSMTKLTLLAGMVAWAAWAVRERVAATYAPHMVPLAAYFAVLLLGPFLTPAFSDSLIGIGKYALMILPYLVIANIAVNRRSIVVVAMAVTITATLSACLALVERFMPGVSLQFDGIGLGAHLDDVSMAGGMAIMRVTGGIGDANWFSYTMATALPLCLYWFRTWTNLWARTAAVGMAGLQAVGIVLSYTRTPLLGLAGAVLFLMWKRMLPLLPMTVLAVAGVVSSPMWLPAGLLDRFFSEKYLKEGSTPMRSEIFAMAVELIREKPVFGHGYQQFGPQFIAHSKTEMGLEWERRDESGEEPAHLLRAHNLYLDVWVQSGIVGLLPLMVFYALLLRELAEVSRYADRRDAELAACLMACLLAFFLCGLGGHSQELKVFWVLAGLAAGLRRLVMSGYRTTS